VDVINLPLWDEFLLFVATSIVGMIRKGRQKQAEMIDITIKGMILKVKKDGGNDKVEFF